MFYSFQSTASQKQNRICFSVPEVKVKFNTSLLTNFICDSQLLHGPINLIKCFITVFILNDRFGDKLFCSALRKFLAFFCNEQMHWFAAWPIHLYPRYSILWVSNVNCAAGYFNFFKKCCQFSCCAPYFLKIYKRYKFTKQFKVTKMCYFSFCDMPSE